MEWFDNEVNTDEIKMNEYKKKIKVLTFVSVFAPIIAALLTASITLIPWMVERRGGDIDTAEPAEISVDYLHFDVRVNGLALNGRDVVLQVCDSEVYLGQMDAYGNRHGWGIRINNEANVWVGDWSNGRRNGEGTLFWREREEGSLRTHRRIENRINDRLNGESTVFWAGGGRTVSRWDDDAEVGFNGYRRIYNADGTFNRNHPIPQND